MYIPLNCPSSNGNWMSKQKPLSGTHLVSSNWHPKSSKSDHLDTIWTPFGHHLDLLSIENPRFWGYPLVNCPITMETHHFQWENPLFLWSFSIAMLNYQRVYMPLNAIKTLGKHHKTMVLGVTPQWYPHGLSTSTVAATTVVSGSRGPAGSTTLRRTTELRPGFFGSCSRVKRTWRMWIAPCPYCSIYLYYT